MPAADTPARGSSANDRFKARFGAWFWGGLILATAAHTVLFIASPTFGFAAARMAAATTETVELPDEIRIPPPPERVAPPAAPVVSDVAADLDLTMPSTELGAHPAETLAPPPARGDELRPGDFVPLTLRPRLLNGRAVARALERHYPALLRNAGIGATALVWFLIDEEGRVVEMRLHESSGYRDLDEAALEVAELMEFSPAYNRDTPVRVWVSLPVTFEVRR